MTAKKATEYISRLDTKRFGFKIARIENLKGDPRPIINDLKNQGVKLIIARTNIHDIETINTLEKTGFEYKDTQLKYYLPLRDKEEEKMNPNKTYKVRRATKKDVDELAAISEEAFDNHGHYFADTRLDRTKCINIYMDWTKRCCLDKSFADVVFAAENENEIMGFLSYKIFHDKDGRFARTRLGAVRKKYRGKGIYSEILKCGKNWGIQLGLEREEHYVLATNTPIINLFIRLGLKFFGGFITFHYWLDSGSKEKEKYAELVWDTNFFGFKVGRIIPDEVKPQELKGLLHSIKKDSFRFVYLFLDPSDKEFNRAAVENKGKLMDEKITYSIKLTQDVSEKRNGHISEYEPKSNNVDKQLINLALQAGNYSRFSIDPNLGADQFFNLYSEWVKNSIHGSMADHIYVYKIKNKIKGFITVKINNKVGEIGLIGVDEKERGAKIGSKLMTFAKSFFSSKGVDEINVVTQKENIIACKFYEKNGFKIKKIQNVYHFWL